MMLPECALFGTVTSRPADPLRRCAPGETLEIRARGLLGKATVIPVASPRPAISRMPWSETWWGLAPQWLTGMQRTLVIRTVVTCELEFGLLAAGLFAGVPPPPGALAPPGLVVAARAALLPGAPGVRALAPSIWMPRASTPRASTRNGKTAATVDLDRLGAPA